MRLNKSAMFTCHHGTCLLLTIYGPFVATSPSDMKNEEGEKRVRRVFPGTGSLGNEAFCLTVLRVLPSNLRPLK